MTRGAARSRSFRPIPRVDLHDLGKQAGPPWRADERAAATAAWLALHE